MLYGEVYAGEIDTCGDEGKDTYTYLRTFFGLKNPQLLCGQSANICGQKIFLRTIGVVKNAFIFSSGTNCVPGHWIPPILMTVFLLIANILLINMLIAIFK